MSANPNAASAPDTAGEAFLQAFRGGFTNMLRWPQLDALWQRIRSLPDRQWYIYAVGEPPPTRPASAGELDRFLTELDALLHREHDEDYCGIVYADDPDDPRFIKVYDPNNLGSVCGSSGAPPPLPGWILSTLPPVALSQELLLPANRRRWWKRLFG